jgi:pimeloyl-ACP methyl ester carboxylesterase
MSRIERFISPDGAVIACDIAGHGPPLMLVHGTSADHTRWAHVIDVLSAEFTTYAVDRRGRGASTDAGEYAIEREFEDLTAVIDGVGREVSVLAHSYGAVCALEAALRAPLVRRLVLYEPPLPVGLQMYAPGLLERLVELLAAGDREGVVTTFLTNIVKMPAADLDSVRDTAGWPGRIAAAHTIPREMRIADDYQPDFARFATLRIPTLLLLGGDSPQFLVEATRRLQKTISGVSCVVMPGQQHVAMDTAPDLFLEHVVAFLG